MTDDLDRCFRGLQKTTLIDFPGSVACVFFTGGCSFRCHYCYNSSLVNKEQPEIKWDAVWSFLDLRRNVLEGVCVSGGEPCLAPFLENFLVEVKRRGFRVKLDTNGYHPSVMRRIFNKGIVDYVAMDVKNSPTKYAHTCGLNQMDLSRIKESIELIKNSGVAYEFRTTVCGELTDVVDIGQIAHYVGGGQRFALQPVQLNTPTLSGLRYTSPLPHVLQEMGETLEEHFSEVIIRGR